MVFVQYLIIICVLKKICNLRKSCDISVYSFVLYLLKIYIGMRKTILFVQVAHPYYTCLIKYRTQEGRIELGIDCVAPEIGCKDPIVIYMTAICRMNFQVLTPLSEKTSKSYRYLCNTLIGIKWKVTYSN